MDAYTAILTRSSVRNYLKKAIARNQIDRLVNAAIHAPSAANRQEWHFTVITDQSLLDKISNDAKYFMTLTRPIELPETLYDKLKKHLPNHNIYQYTKPVNANGKPIHYNTFMLVQLLNWL